MSDTEDTKQKMSEGSCSSDEESSSDSRLDQLHQRKVQPKPQDKDSSSDSSSEDEKEEEDDLTSSKSESISKQDEDSKAAKSSSSEGGQVIDKGDDDDSSSSETEDECKDELLDDVETAASIPVPSVRKISLQDEEVVKVDQDAESDKELSDDEEEEELVVKHPVEVEVEEVVETRHVEEENEEPVDTTELEPEPRPHVNGSGAEIRRPQFRHSASSMSDEEIIPLSSNHNTASSPVALAAQSPSPKSVAIEEKKKELQAASTRAESPVPASQSPLPTRANANNLTKIYTEALESNNNNEGDKGQTARSKPAKDITQIYTQGIAKTTNTPPASPKPVPQRSRDITQLYTTGFKKPNSTEPAPPCIVADKLNPKKHNMSTSVDKDAIRQAYEDVRSDTSDTEWAVFKFDGNQLKAAGTGNNFKDFKSSFSNEDRGFGYIRINTGDEMSKRAKFVFVTWVGPSVSVMKKAKMSTDKALMKEIIQNMSVELQFENHTEFSHDHFKNQVDKAAGARYGTGERAL